MLTEAKTLTVGRHTIIIGEAMKVMRSMPEKSFQLIVLDPPYFDTYGDMPAEKPNYVELAIQARRLLKPDGVVVLFGKQPQLAYDWAAGVNRYLDIVDEFVTIKRCPMPPVGRWRAKPGHENVWILRLKETKVTDLKLDYTRVARFIEEKDKKGHFSRIRRHGDKPTSAYYEGYPSTVVARGQILPTDPEYVGHPTQKPLSFVKMMVEASTDPGDPVLDPFLGSGTTLVACLLTDRVGTGIELNPKYAEIAYNRLLRAQSNLSVFINGSE